jgi:predicted acyl esterase
MFLASHRIRLDISSSAFPKYDRNPGTGESLGMSAKFERSQQRIYHDREHPSHIVLPVIPAKP